MSTGQACSFDDSFVNQLNADLEQAISDNNKPEIEGITKLLKRETSFQNSCHQLGALTALPTGVWNGHFNGFPVTMTLHFVTSSAQVIGEIDEQSTGVFAITNGAWDATQGQLIFTRQLPDVPNEPFQNYIGYLFTGPESEQTPTLAGTVTRPDGSQAGWYATYAPANYPQRLPGE